MSATLRIMTVQTTWILLGVTSLAQTAFAGPISELYLTSKTEHGGGKSLFNVVQGGAASRSWTAQHGNELALAVGSTVRTLGILLT